MFLIGAIPKCIPRRSLLPILSQRKTMHSPVAFLGYDVNVQ